MAINGLLWALGAILFFQGYTSGGATFPFPVDRMIPLFDVAADELL